MPAPKRGVAYTFDTALPDAAVAGALKVNPTLAAGDVKISKDGGAFANVATLPVVEPAAGRMVKVSLSAAEMDADRIVVQFVDQTNPAEWNETVIPIQTDEIHRTVCRGTVGGGATTTSVPTSALAPAAAVADQFKGRIVIFDEFTASANLRGVAAEITASSAGGVLTVSALPAAPANGDRFVIV